MQATFSILITNLEDGRVNHFRQTHQKVNSEQSGLRGRLRLRLQGHRTSCTYTHPRHSQAQGRPHRDFEGRGEARGHFGEIAGRCCQNRETGELGARVSTGDK